MKTMINSINTTRLQKLVVLYSAFIILSLELRCGRDVMMRNQHIGSSKFDVRIAWSTVRASQSGREFWRDLSHSDTCTQPALFATTKQKSEAIK